MKIKTVIHESNVYPGLVTRILGERCDKVLLNVEGTKKHLKFTDNTEVVGNPLRMEFENITREAARKRLGIASGEFFIVSFGGSLGSEIMNERIIEFMHQYSQHTLNVRHLHAAGTKYYGDIKQRFPKLCGGVGKCKVTAYIDNMPTVLKAADLAITRSGAMTMSELGRAGVAAILIPSPNVVANHQYMNAKYMSDSHAAVMIEEKDLNVDTLTNTVREIQKNEFLRDELRQGVTAFSPKNTEEKITKSLRMLLE